MVNSLQLLCNKPACSKSMIWKQLPSPGHISLMYWELPEKIISFVNMFSKFPMFRFKVIGSLVLPGLMLLSCGIPITTSTKYPIDILYENEPIERPYSEIGWVEITSEDTLSADQTTNKRMMQRGNDAKTKELLTARLVIKAQKIGANAIIKVQYQYYTTVKSEGYLLKGLAVRYRGE